MNAGAAIAPMLLVVAGLLAMPGSTSAADGLGRLFTTAAERARLDEARRGAPVPTPSVPVARPQDDADEATQGPAGLTVRGVVARSGGRSTAWVNDTNTYQGDLGAASQRVERTGIAGDQVTVRLSDGKSSVRVKVGQTLDPASAQVSDLATEPETGAVPPAGMPAEDDDEE